MNIPSNLKYTETDEWVLVEGKTVTIGVSDYAQDQLSDIVFWESNVELGDKVKSGSLIATLESVKAAGEVITPVSGEVVAINDSLADTPEVVNSDPYGKAWMIKVEMDNPDEVNSLLDQAAYQKYIDGRGH